MESALSLAFLFFYIFSEKRKSFLCRDVDVAVVVAAAAVVVVVVAKNRFQLKVSGEVVKVMLA